MTKLLIDTNILIYTVDEKSVFNTRARQILQDPGVSIFITTKSISEFFAVCTKLKYKQEIILGFYNELKNNTSILFPNENSLDIFETIFNKYKPVGNRVFDMEIVSIMLANGITKIATFNTKDFIAVNEIELFDIQ
jgi:predicted nucleic acid-binding protein